MQAARIGLDLWSVRDAILADRDATLARIAEIGYAGVEPAVEPDHLCDPSLTRAERLSNAKKLRCSIGACGLEVASATTRLPSPDDADWAFEELSELGVPTAIAAAPDDVLGFSRDVLASIERLSKFADNMNRLAAIARSWDMRIGYHNHYFEWPVLEDGRLGYDALFDLLDADIIAEVDVYWAQAAGQDPAAVITALGPRVEYVHFKDGNLVCDWTLPQPPLGLGSANLEEALAAATFSRWNIVEIDAFDGDPLDGAQADFNWLRERMPSDDA